VGLGYVSGALEEGHHIEGSDQRKILADGSEIRWK